MDCSSGGIVDGVWDGCLQKAGGDDPQSSVADDTFVIGMECNYAPFNWTQTDDSNGAVAIADGSGLCGRI